MAERIAEQIDAARFGVKTLYLIGSTKNATAGPASDIDLLVHFAGSSEQRETLRVWLEGWSRCLRYAPGRFHEMDTEIRNEPGASTPIASF